jgi:hypothetical protein
MKLEWKLDSHTMNWIGYGDGLECHGVVECEKATFQEIHDAKIDNIARANGYVKLEPGQVVVTMTLVYAAKFRMDDEILQGMETNDEAYAEALDVIHRFERGAAIDASGDKA